MKGKCPACGIFKRIQQLDAVGDDLVLMLVPQPLYQFSYPRESGHIPPRCERCYDKAVKKRDRRIGDGKKRAGQKADQGY